MQDICPEPVKKTDFRHRTYVLDKLTSQAKRGKSFNSSVAQKSKIKVSSGGISDQERKAREQILKEVERGAQRYKMVGPQGWKKPTCLATDKKFLERILRSGQSKSSAIGKKNENKKVKC